MRWLPGWYEIVVLNGNVVLVYSLNSEYGSPILHVVTVEDPLIKCD